MIIKLILIPVAHDKVAAYKVFEFATFSEVMLHNPKRIKIKFSFDF